jgi:hypothetical protein
MEPLVQPLHLQIEKRLAVVHRNLWAAALAAESMRDQGLADDLHLLAESVRNLSEDLLRGVLRRKRSSTPRT